MQVVKTKSIIKIMCYIKLSYLEEILPAYLLGEKQQLHHLKLGRVCRDSQRKQG